MEDEIRQHLLTIQQLREQAHAVKSLKTLRSASSSSSQHDVMTGSDITNGSRCTDTSLGVKSDVVPSVRHESRDDIISSSKLAWFTAQERDSGCTDVDQASPLTDTELSQSCEVQLSMQCSIPPCQWLQPSSTSTDA